MSYNTDGQEILNKVLNLQVLFDKLFKLSNFTYQM